MRTESRAFHIQSTQQVQHETLAELLYFKKRFEACFKTERGQWWVWWKNRYSNDMQFWFNTPLKKVRDFEQENARQSFYRRHRPEPSKNRTRLTMQYVDEILSGHPLWKIIDSARGIAPQHKSTRKTS